MAKIYEDYYDTWYGEVGILCCGNCGSHLMETETYEKRSGSLDTHEDILKYGWYVPQDIYNQDITHCHCCGRKLEWKNFYLNRKRGLKTNEIYK